MKAISADMILTSASTRADGSLGLRLATSELQPNEKTAFFELLNRPLKVIIQGTDEPVDSLVEVKNKMGFKTPSQRLRAVLYIRWKQEHPQDSNGSVPFQEFYDREMETMIDRIKARLEQE